MSRMQRGDVARVRRFSRFYTQRIGMLREGLAGSSFSLPEARVLYELAQKEPATAKDLSRELTIDPGYLSRILRGFERREMLSKSRSPEDQRVQLLRLTEQGRKAFEQIDRGTAEEIEALLAPLSAQERRKLVGAMEQIEELLGGARPEPG